MKDAGAIASARAGELYGLNILQNNLQVRKSLFYSFVYDIKQSNLQVKSAESTFFFCGAQTVLKQTKQMTEVGYKFCFLEDYG